MADQNVAVLIDFTGGSIEQGLICRASIRVDGAIVEDSQTEFHLPGNHNIEQKYFQWQGSRDVIEKLRNEQGIFPEEVRQESVRVLAHSKGAQREFENIMREWFGSKEFENLRLWILGEGSRYFQKDPSIPIIFNFSILGQSNQLQKLPWQLWDLFEKYLAKSEAVMAADYSKSLGNLHFPVKILAVFGSDEGGLDFQNEIEALEDLQNTPADSKEGTKEKAQVERVKIKIIKEPSFDDLCDQLMEHRWDILLFSGHSNTQQDFRESKLKINRHTVVEIGDLRDQFRFAIDNGLKLAIFNSCDGLGIASYLSREIGSKVPSIIVMKEPVYDIAASRFFVQFFTHFSKGDPLFLATRKARIKIAQLKNYTPGPVLAADWLPVIFQNPTQPEFIWPSFQRQGRKLWWENFLFNPIYVLGIIPAAVLLVIAIHGLVSRPDAPLIPSVEFDPPELINSLTNDGFSVGEEILIDDVLIGSEESSPTQFIRPKVSSDIASASSNPSDTLAQKGTKAFLEALNLERRSSERVDSIKQQYTAAQQYFSASLKEFKNDPEVLIYLNNVEVALARLGSARPVVTLGVSIPIKTTEDSGNFLIDEDAAGSQEILRGVAQAQRQLNCGISRSGNIEDIEDENAIRKCSIDTEGESPLLMVRIGNHENNRRGNIEKIKEVAQKLISHQDVLGIVAWYTSDTTLTTSELFETSKTVLISPTSTAQFEAGELSSYIFRTSPTDSFAVELIVDYLNSLNVKTVGIVWEEADNFSRLYKNTFTAFLSGAENLGALRSVTPQNCGRLSDMHYEDEQEPCLRNADGTTVESLLIIPSREDLDIAEDIANSYRQLLGDENQPILIGADTLYSYESTQSDAFDGMIFAVPWFHNQADSRNVFEIYAAALWGGDVSWRSAMAYDATAVFQEALKKSTCIRTLEDTASCRIEIRDNLDQNVRLEHGATGSFRVKSGNRDVPDNEKDRANGDGVLVKLNNKLFEHIPPSPE